MGNTSAVTSVRPSWELGFRKKQNYTTGIFFKFPMFTKKRFEASLLESVPDPKFVQALVVSIDLFWFSLMSFLYKGVYSDYPLHPPFFIFLFSRA